jgi:hypothetical protein
MRIDEVEQAETIDLTKLVALSQFLLGRAEDTGAPKRVSLDTFLKQAHNLGIGITAENLKNLATAGPLQDVIVNVTPDEVIFKGANNISGKTQPSPEQNQNVVASMAKRALK